MLHPADPSLRALLLSLLLTVPTLAADWPQWRGPNRDASWNETGIVQTLPATGLKMRWRAPVAMGFSSPVVADGKVYVSDAVMKNPLVVERVQCFDADSGRLRWTHTYEHPVPDWFFSEDQARGPGATPIVSKRRLYALDLWGGLICLDAVSGRVIWKQELKEEYQLKGTSVDTSPLIEGDVLILMLGGKPGAGVVAFDRETGREVWRSLEESVTWSSPIVIEAGGVRQLIVWTQQSVSSLNPTTGKVYWREATSTGGSPGTAGVSTPVHLNGKLLVSGWMFQLAQDRPSGTTLWPEAKGVARRILSDTSTPVLLGEQVYGARTGGEFVCLDALTGAERWKTAAITDPRNGSSIHATLRGSTGFLLNDRGELIQCRLVPARYEEISRMNLIEPTWPFSGRKVAWAAPAFAHRNVYARNDRELVCVSLAASSYH